MADKVFLKSYQYFRICNNITLLYSVAKIVTAPIFAIMCDDKVELQWWLICLFLISILQFLHYRKIYSISKNVNVFIKLAGELNHSAIVSQEEREVDLR